MRRRSRSDDDCGSLGAWVLYRVLGCVVGVLEGACQAALNLLHLRQLNDKQPRPAALLAPNKAASSLPTRQPAPKRTVPAKMLQIVVLGDSGVGKTSLLSQYIHHTAATSADLKPTVGAEFFTKEFDVDGVKVTAQIWDTSGGGPALSRRFYSGAAACVLVFDMACLESFTSLGSWYHLVLSNEKNPLKEAALPFMLIGHRKTRRPSSPTTQMVTANSILQWCDSKGDIPYYEVGGAHALESLEQAFANVVTSALHYTEAHRSHRRTKHAQRPGQPVTMTAGQGSSTQSQMAA
ncbi:hypothetical protein WJX72_008498 [[Myrmecia] bisecta]|uniref:Uncharacterized protein n=1 Tax=[Myrmecia] bisecta TaxID=41462 RepID=A0AAW1R7Z8_9CHLO